MAHLKSQTPMLSVFDLGRTMEFYCNRLDFRCLRTVGSPAPFWCYLRRDGADVMFIQRPGIPIADVRRQDPDCHALYFYPDDLDALHAECEARGLPVTAPVISKYGFRVFELRDPDSHILRFIQATSDRRTGEE